MFHSSFWWSIFSRSDPGYFFVWCSQDSPKQEQAVVNVQKQRLVLWRQLVNHAAEAKCLLQMLQSVRCLTSKCFLFGLRSLFCHTILYNLPGSCSLQFVSRQKDFSSQMSSFELSASGIVFSTHDLKQNCVMKCYFKIYFMVKKPTSEHLFVELQCCQKLCCGLK